MADSTGTAKMLRKGIRSSRPRLDHPGVSLWYRFGVASCKAKTKPQHGFPELSSDKVAK